MKAFLLCAMLFLGLAANAETCKSGDLKDCARVLKSKIDSEDFIATYDNICAENKGFKCLKRTVRGDADEEIKYMAEEFPKAHIFRTKQGGEDKVFVLEKR